MATSLFHELRSLATRQGLNPSEDAYQSALDDMESRLRASSAWTPALRERALARVASARAAGMPDRAIAAATILIERRAERARDGLERGWAVNGAVYGVTAGAMEEEFWRLRRSHAQLPAEARRRDLDPALPDVPNDPATRYAFAALGSSYRCGTCGQFLGRSVLAAHTCPPANRRPLMANPAAPAAGADVVPPESTEVVSSLREALLSATFAPEAELQAVAATAAAAVDPFVGAGVDPIGMDDFQAAYDAAMARVADGDTDIPAWNDPVAGEVTGGLGSRDGGNSFGIELEIDFPDDEYPYRARHELARLLHEEGVVAQPYVMRWHYVGDDRPGGTFTQDPDGWICEFDRSVDDVEGQRGVEIKSQILFDEPRTWRNLSRITEIAAQLGGQATVRTGLHVNVGGSAFDPSDPAAHNALLRLAAAYDDTLVRLAHNPASGPSHRGRGYCGYAEVPAAGYRSVAEARARSNHYQAFNLGHLPAAGERMSPSSRVEVRLWDSTLDLGRIQAAVTMSLALNRLAVDGAAPGQQPEPAGVHRTAYGRRRLIGEEWERSTESFRRLMSLVASAGAFSDKHLNAFTTMFAASRWQAR
jgi:hypothetical protein